MYCHRLGRQRRIGKQTIVECSLPKGGKSILALLRGPICLHDIVVRAHFFTQQRIQELMGGVAGIERFNQGLLDRDRAVIGAHITPRFQIVRFGNLPLALGGSLVGIEPKLDAEIDLGQCTGKVEIHGGLEDRICTQDQECFHLAGVHRIDQGAQ